MTTDWDGPRCRLTGTVLAVGCRKSHLEIADHRRCPFFRCPARDEPDEVMQHNHPRFMVPKVYQGFACAASLQPQRHVQAGELVWACLSLEYAGLGIRAPDPAKNVR